PGVDIVPICPESPLAVNHVVVKRRSAQSARGPARRAAMDALEQRLVLAAVQPTVYEQYMLELINRGRANPAAEATRLGIGLNEGLSGNVISAAVKQPLAMNLFLNDAA